MDSVDVVLVDLIFALITAAFFGAAVLLVRLCDRIIGPDDAEVTERAAPVQAERALVDAGSGAAGDTRS